MFNNSANKGKISFENLKKKRKTHLDFPKLEEVLSVPFLEFCQGDSRSVLKFDEVQRTFSGPLH